MSLQESAHPPLLSQADARALKKLINEANLKQLLRNTRNICWVILSIVMICFTQIERPVRVWFALSALQCLAKVIFAAINGIAYLRGGLSLCKGIETTMKFLWWIAGLYLGVSSVFTPDTPNRWWLVGVNIAWYLISTIIFSVIVVPIGKYIYKAAEE